MMMHGLAKPKKKGGDDDTVYEANKWRDDSVVVVMTMVRLWVL